MSPQVFGGGVRETAITSAAGTLMVLAILLILCLPRKYVIIPVLLTVCLLPQGNVLVVAGLHLFPARVISLVGWARVLLLFRPLKEEGRPWVRVTPIDKAFTWWALARVAAFMVLWHEAAALINQLGFLWVTWGMYFLLRVLIRDRDDAVIVMKLFGAAVAVNASAMIFEHFKNVNLFGLILGGVSAVPELRDGKIRCQGAFQHPLLAGTFGATLIPLFLYLWGCRRSKGWAAVGLLASAVMVWTSASSTPALATAAVVAGLFFWPFRNQMRLLRWGIGLTITGLHLLMKAPVWFLIARVDVMGASSGTHRAMLVDQFVRHFWDWWLVGVKTTANWGWDMWDLSNQFVAEGEVGGLVTFVLFLLVISRAFSRVGSARRAPGIGRKTAWLLWLLGVAVFSHVVGFFGVSYWDQTIFAWFALLAIICATTDSKDSLLRPKVAECSVETEAGAEPVPQEL